MAHLCCLFVKNKTTDTKCNSEMDLTGMDKQLKKLIATSLGENDFESISYPETKKYAPFRSVFLLLFFDVLDVQEQFIELFLVDC